MPKFGTRSKGNLQGCHEDIRVLFYTVVEGFDCAVIAGKRGEQLQNYLFDAGLSKVRYPDSFHNKEPLSLAADVPPYPIDWQDKERFYFFAGYVKGIAERLYDEGKMKHRIRWGGDWDGDTDLHDQKFMDLVHFELIGVEE